MTIYEPEVYNIETQAFHTQKILVLISKPTLSLGGSIEEQYIKEAKDIMCFLERMVCTRTLSALKKELEIKLK